MAMVAIVIVWQFVAHLESMKLPSIDQRMGRPLRPGHKVGQVEFGYRPSESKPNTRAKSPTKGQSSRLPTGAPPRSVNDGSTGDDHYYSGPIRFYNLASTLHGIPGIQGHKTSNRNVLFAASSLKSAANLIPMACDMASRDRNYVHLVVLGRDSLSLNDLLEINGVDLDSCTVDFHDGRPDYSEYSSDLRAELSVAGAMDHVNTFMHPRVIITDDSVVEDVFFTKAIRGKAKELGHPIIEIPKAKYEDLLWITRLDSTSLANYHKPSIQLLVHAPSESSGSLIRLLDSLKAADYAGLAPPHLILDLPSHIEPFARDYIRDIVWPPRTDPLVPYQNTVTLHHHISSAKLTTETNAIRLLESFYPANTEHSHVLLLSSQIELSPLFYHYLMFHLLEHRYSSPVSYDSDHLFGIALAPPQSYLNASTPFVAPTIVDMSGKKYTHKNVAPGQESTVPFLWQAPNADSALIFGDKWAELHGYLENRLRASHEVGAVLQTPIKPLKLISESQPGWMEYVLELMRARGWSMLYPAVTSSGGWATVHSDLYQAPEEFSDKPTTAADTIDQASSDSDTKEPFLSGKVVEPHESPKEQRTVVQHSQPLHEVLPFDGEAPEMSSLPRMAYLGNMTSAWELEAEVIPYKQLLRQQIGGCLKAQAIIDRPVAAGKTDDLFCFVDSEVEIDEDAAAPDTESGEVGVKGAVPKGESSTSETDATSVRDPTDSDTPDAVDNQPVVDTTAKQKLAYAKALGVSVDDKPAKKPAAEKPAVAQDSSP